MENNKGYVEEQATIKLLPDGTLVVKSDLYPKVKRVLVENETYGTFYYLDGTRWWE